MHILESARYGELPMTPAAWLGMDGTLSATRDNPNLTAQQSEMKTDLACVRAVQL